jgi:hypothetical protein
VRDNSMLFSIQTFSMGFGMERVVRSCPGVVESITLTQARLACYSSCTSTHVISCFEVCLIVSFMFPQC